MFKKSLFIVAIVAGALTLAGCKSKSKNNPQQPPGDDGGNGPASTQLDMSGIVNNNFFANYSFDFSDAVTKKYKIMEGTSFETPVKRHSFYFNGQQILKSEKKALDQNEYCELYIETNPKEKGSDIEFVQGTHLKVGTVSTFKNNDDVSFNIVLQANFSTQFQLFCKNVQNVEEVNFHIGHILLITQDNHVGPQEPKIKKIGFHKDEFNLIFSSGSDFVTLTASFWGKQITKDTSWSRLAWRLCNSTNGTCYTEWEYQANGGKIFHPGEVGLILEVNKKNQVNKIIKNMRSLELHLSVDSEDNKGVPQMTHVVDLGGYCSTEPQSFINTDFNTTGCP